MAAVSHSHQAIDLTPAEARALLAERVRAELHLSLDEFIEQWQAGAFGAVDDDPVALELAVLLPIVGIDPWTDARRP